MIAKCVLRSLSSTGSSGRRLSVWSLSVWSLSVWSLSVWSLSVTETVLNSAASLCFVFQDSLTYALRSVYSFSSAKSLGRSHQTLGDKQWASNDPHPCQNTSSVSPSPSLSPPILIEYLDCISLLCICVAYLCCISVLHICIACLHCVSSLHIFIAHLCCISVFFFNPTL